MSKLSRFTESSNPMMKDVLDRELVGSTNVMTAQGAVNKTFILFFIMLAGAAVGYLFQSQILLWGGMIGGAIIYFITSRNPEKSGTLAPLYAFVEGLFVGTVTAIYAYMFDGIIMHAVSLTFAILFMMLTLYKTGVIKVTEKLRSVVSVAVGAVMLVYLINIVLYFIGIPVTFMHDGGPIAIGISLVIIGIASMNLLLDFDNFDKGEDQRAPKYMEWYFGMGLLFTLIWLYIELLRLLSFFMGDD